WSAFVSKPELYAAGGAAYRALTEERGQPVSAPPPAEASGRRGWQIATGGAIVATSLLATGFVVYWGKLRETGPAFQTNAAGEVILDGSRRPTQTSGYGGYCQREPSGALSATVIDEKGNMIPLPAACAHGTFYQTMSYV